MRPKGTVAKWKTDEVTKLAQLIQEYPVVGIVDMTSFPSKQLVSVKKVLKGKALIKMSKKSLIQRALEKAGKKELVSHVTGQPALLLTKNNPFEISKILVDNKVNGPAKAGSIVPKEILVPAGETSFSPGPMVGELQKAGLKAAIEKGKVVIKEESLIAKAGEKVDAKKAELITKLGLEPIELKLKLVAAYEKGTIFGEAALSITAAQVMEWLKQASAGSFNFTFNIGYPTKYNIKMFVQKSYTNSKAVALKANFVCEATVKDLLAKANAQAKALEAKVPAQPAPAAPEQK